MQIGVMAVKSNRALGRQLEQEAKLPDVAPVKQKRKPRKADQPDPSRQPTPRRVARRNAQQLAKPKGSTLRATDRELETARGGCQVREITVSPVERVRREGGRRDRAGIQRCSQPARIPGARSLTFFAGQLELHSP